MASKTVMSGPEDAANSIITHGKFKKLRSPSTRKRISKSSSALKDGGPYDPFQKTEDEAAAGEKDSTLLETVAESRGSNSANNGNKHNADHFRKKKNKKNTVMAHQSQQEGQSSSPVTRGTNDSSRPQQQQPSQHHRRSKGNKWNQKQGVNTLGKENQSRGNGTNQVVEGVVGVGGTKSGKQRSPSLPKQKSKSPISKSSKKNSSSRTDVSERNDTGSPIQITGTGRNQAMKNARMIGGAEDIGSSRKLPQSPLDHGAQSKNSIKTSPLCVSHDGIFLKGDDSERKKHSRSGPHGHQHRRHYSFYRNNNSKMQKGPRRKDRSYQQHQRQHSARSKEHLIEKKNDLDEPTLTSPDLAGVSKTDQLGHTRGLRSSGTDKTSKLDYDRSFEPDVCKSDMASVVSQEKHQAKDEKETRKISADGECSGKPRRESHHVNGNQRNIRGHRKGKQGWRQKLATYDGTRANCKAKAIEEEIKKRGTDPSCDSEINGGSVPDKSYGAKENISQHELEHSNVDICTCISSSSSITEEDSKSGRDTAGDYIETSNAAVPVLAGFGQSEKPATTAQYLGPPEEEYAADRLERDGNSSKVHVDHNGECCGPETREMPSTTDQIIPQNVITTNAAGAAILSRLYKTDTNKDFSCAMSSSSSSSLSASCAEAMAVMGTSTVEANTCAEAFERCMYPGESRDFSSEQFQREISDHLDPYQQQTQVAYSGVPNHGYFHEPIFVPPIVAPAMFAQAESGAFAGTSPLQYPIFVSGAAMVMQPPSQYPLSPETVYYTQSNLPDDGMSRYYCENEYCDESVAPNTMVQQEESVGGTGRDTVWNVNAPAFEPKGAQ